MHHIIYTYDSIGRRKIHSATALRPLTDPLVGLRSEERDQLLFTPLSSEERRLLRAAKRSKLEPDQRLVVVHQILSERRENLLQRKAFQMDQAVRLRRQDAIDHENMRIARESTFLGRQAEEAARIARTTRVEPTPYREQPAEVPMAADHRGEWKYEEFVDPRLLRPLPQLQHSRHAVEQTHTLDNDTVHSRYQNSFLRKLAAEAEHEPDIISTTSLLRSEHDDEQAQEEEGKREEHGQEM